MSRSLAERCKPFVRSYVWRDDLVPRLSVANLLALRDAAMLATRKARTQWSLPKQISTWASSIRSITSNLFSKRSPQPTEHSTQSSIVASTTSPSSATVRSPSIPQTEYSGDSSEMQAVATALADAAETDAATHDETGGPLPDVATNTNISAETEVKAAFTIHTLAHVGMKDESPLYLSGRCFYFRGKLDDLVMHEVPCDALMTIYLSTTMLTDHMVLNYEIACDQLTKRHAPTVTVANTPICGIRTQLTPLMEFPQ